MPLGTLDRTPPPFFRQGPSALTKLAVCSALAVFLMVADTRFALTQPLRALLATALHPVQRTLLAPVDWWGQLADYAGGLQHAIAAESAARRDLAAQAVQVARANQLQTENVRLRALLDLRAGLSVRAHAAEVLYESTDPYSRKVVIDRGLVQGIVAGSPVVSDAGVIGQVTRAYPLSSEVTLLTDKDAAVPVLNTRTMARSAAFGAATGDALELRFMAGNADVQVGDLLQTSGVDGVYPPGLPVAKVVSVDRKVDSGFAKILLAPAAVPDGVRHVLVLDPIGLQLPPRPEPKANEPTGAASSASAPTRKGAHR
ncbi:MAG: rod shape-determining protein MreC [Burkholderiaceae bacterium]|nr:rod shape-determining protein MreC [Burkholderiaceae bacterium]